jgi:hypothetical protein
MRMVGVVIIRRKTGRVRWGRDVLKRRGRLLLMMMMMIGVGAELFVVFADRVVHLFVGLFFVGVVEMTIDKLWPMGALLVE